MDTHLAELNDLQKKAATTTEGPVMIIAGAGTGKTKTVTHRMLHLMRLGVPGHKILGITFTNKAAREMRERMYKMLGKEPSARIWEEDNDVPMLKTFHSLGVHLLKIFHKEANLPKQFTILDSDESMDVIKDCMAELSIDTKTHDARTMRTIISNEKNKGSDPAQLEATSRSPVTDIAARIWHLYEQKKKSSRMVDFDDLLTRVLDLLEHHTSIREAVQMMWDYIHVDEYQDTNHIQYKLVKIIAERTKNLCVVGDTDQTIYSWRGAQIKNMLSFERDYPNAVVLILEENYRSTQIILQAADAVITKNTARFEKSLMTKNALGNKIQCFIGMNERDEAGHVAGCLKKLITAGENPDELAILYRTNFQSRILEEALIRDGVPYRLIGTTFFERREIKDALAYLRLARDPENTLLLSRIINVPKRGLGPASVTKIISGMSSELSDKAKSAYDSFTRTLHLIREFEHSSTPPKPPSEIVRFALLQSGLYQSLETGHSDDAERIQNLEELVTIASEYDDLAEETRFETFLEEVSLHEGGNRNQSDSGVRLMTIHASKGLEFNHVFITGLEQGLFPSSGRDHKTSIEDQEEERRLFYVALTRAKKELHLSYAYMRTIFGREQWNEASEFLRDIPEEIMEYINSESGLDKGIKTVYLEW